jgi:hypothetical protein
MQSNCAISAVMQEKVGRADSDVDVAIQFTKKIAPKDLFYAKQELEEIIKKDVDLIDLENSSDVFKYEILMNGKLLFVKNEFEFDLYKLKVFKEYLELNESRYYIIKRIKNKEDTNAGIK